MMKCDFDLDLDVFELERAKELPMLVLRFELKGYRLNVVQFWFCLGMLLLLIEALEFPRAESYPNGFGLELDGLF